MDRRNSMRMPGPSNDQQRLARTLAGLQPAPEPPPITSLDFAPAASQFPAFAGPRNEPGLPAFEQPGQQSAGMMPWRGLPPQQAPAAPPMPQQQMPAAQMQGPPLWLGLNDQSRTAAFDPTRDFSDPGNVFAVDELGRSLPKRGLLGPV